MSSASGMTPVQAIRNASSGVSKSPSSGSISSRTPSAMRPTISSANKTAPGSSNSSSNSRMSNSISMRSLQPPTPRRITSAMSTGDIQQALNDSSSSEEAGNSEPKTNVKARVMSFEKSTANRSPARTPLFTPSKSSATRRSLFNSPATAQSQTAGNTQRSAPSTPVGGPSDVNRVLSRASCELAIEAMKTSAEQLLLLQRRLAGGTGSSSETGSESNLSDRERAELLQLLSTSSTPIIQSLKNLQFPPTGMEFNTDTSSPQSSTTDANPLVMHQMMQQYSDMLLAMVQQRMGGVATPPSPR